MTAKKKRRSQPDPIFAAIERLRRSELAVDAAGDDQSPAYDPGNTELAPKFHDARRKFARTVPTTPAGLIAFASYVNEAQKRMCGANPYFERVEDAEAFASTLETAVRNLVSH